MTIPACAPVLSRRAYALAGVVAEPVFTEGFLAPHEVAGALGRLLGVACVPLGHLRHLGGLLITGVLGQMTEQQHIFHYTAEYAPQGVLHESVGHRQRGENDASLVPA